jgi:multiple sugar transport system substrate-binding protein
MDASMPFPYETVPTLMFVNKSLLAKENIQMPKEDWTWEDMYEICRKVTKDTDKDGLLDQFGTYNYSWRDAFYTSGGKLYDERQEQLSFTDSRVLDAIKYIKRLNDLNQGQSVTQEDFNEGGVAFMPLTFAEYRTYKTYPYRIKKYTRFQWDCITFPAGREGENISKVDALLMGINSKAKHERLAWEFLKQLTYTEEMQMDVFLYSQGVPALKSVASSKEGANIIQEDMDEGEQVISSTLLCNVIENGIIEPRLLQYQQVMNLADGEVSKILQENKNVDSSMKIFQRTISKYLQQQK